MKSPRSTLAFAAAFGMLFCSAGLASADDTIKHPGDHLNYSVEVEPHVLIGWDGVYDAGGLGLGARFSIPIVQNGFVPSINNSVAISFGLDLVWYGGCYAYEDPGHCGAQYVQIPVAMQWNFWVAHNWSVFGEPGLEIYHGFLGDCDAMHANCVTPTVTGVLPALWIGGRYHLSESTALTLRIGFPAFSFGVSFFP
jgi:hypothetical protein